MPHDSDIPLRDTLDARVADLQCVLFDLDGTLVDTVALILASFRYATREVLGEALPDEELMRNVGVPLARQMQEFSPEHAEELLRVYREHNGAAHDDMIAEYPGTELTLQALSARGLKLGVVTSKSMRMAMRGLERFGLERFFPVVISADCVTTHKPDPHPLRVAAERLDVSLTRTAYVGDSPHDMAAAVGAHTVSIAALWGAFPPDSVLAPGPDFAISRLPELLRILDGDGAEFRLS